MARPTIQGPMQDAAERDTVHSACGRLLDAITDLDKLVEDLRVRLEPVLVPLEDAKEGGVGCAPEPPRSALEQAIHGYADHVNSIRARVADTRHRLAL